MRSTRFTVAFTLLVLGAIACYNPNQPDYPPSTVAVQGVKVTPQVVNLVAIGEARQLVATISPADATDQAVVWESADASIVSVDAFGKVTAKALGNGVLITAVTHDGHFQASVNVSVNP
jgi:uncharacterized protein YjdB